jgi:hypothetical protein
MRPSDSHTNPDLTGADPQRSEDSRDDSGFSPVAGRVSLSVTVVVSVNLRDSQRRVDHGGPEQHRSRADRSCDNIETVVACLVIVISFNADFEVPDPVVGAEAYGPSPA